MALCNTRGKSAANVTCTLGSMQVKRTPAAQGLRRPAGPDDNTQQTLLLVLARSSCLAGSAYTFTTCLPPSSASDPRLPRRPPISLKEPSTILVNRARKAPRRCIADTAAKRRRSGAKPAAICATAPSSASKPIGESSSSIVHTAASANSHLLRAYHKLLCKKFVNLQDRPGEDFRLAILLPPIQNKTQFIWLPVDVTSAADSGEDFDGTGERDPANIEIVPDLGVPTDDLSLASAWPNTK